MSKRDGAGGTKHAPHPEQFYVEPRHTNAQIFDAVDFGRGSILWDASCGSGRILDEAWKRGYRTVGTDIVDRPGRDERHRFAVADFLRLRELPFRPPLGVEVSLLCNPPYGTVRGVRGMAARFVAHARKHFGDQLARAGFIVPIGFMASQDRYFDRYASDPPALALICCQRPSMPRGDMLDAPNAGKGGMEDYCVLVWTRETIAPGETRTIFMRPTVAGRPPLIERRKR